MTSRTIWEERSVFPDVGLVPPRGPGPEVALGTRSRVRGDPGREGSPFRLL